MLMALQTVLFHHSCRRTEGFALHLVISLDQFYDSLSKIISRPREQKGTPTSPLHVHVSMACCRHLKTLQDAAMIVYIFCVLFYMYLDWFSPGRHHDNATQSFVKRGHAIYMRPHQLSSLSIYIVVVRMYMYM